MNGDAKRAGMETVAVVAQQTMQARAQGEHGVLARASHIAALAAERLAQARAASPAATAAAVADVMVMLREVQNDGYLAYLRQQGSEADYQKAGVKARNRFQTPGGKWRKLTP